MIRVGKRACCFVLLFSLLFQGMSVPMTSQAKQKKLQLNSTKKTIAVGDKFQLKLKKIIYPKKKITWKSSNKKVAVVSSNGRVTGKKAGKTKITAQYAGSSQKAVCQVTVKKKTSTVKPEVIPDALTTNTPQPAPASASPVPTAAPQTSASAQPTVSAVPVDSSILVVSTSLVEKDGVTMTAYLINKLFYGDITVSLNGKIYNDKTSGRNLLMMLATSATGDTPKQNSTGTIRVTRKSLEDEYWTLEDLELSKTYYLRAETKNTLDPEKAECGVIYVKGDVRSEVEIYTNKQ